MEYPSLPEITREIRPAHRVMLIGAYTLGLFWLIGSLLSIVQNHPGLFARMGSAGLLAVVLYFWMRSSVRSQFFDQLAINNAIAVSVLTSASLSGMSEREGPKESFEQQRHMQMRVRKDETRDQIVEVLLVVIATMQWGFGDCFLEASKCST